MFYLASSEKLGCYIIGQTQYSQYFRSVTHFTNAISQLGLIKSDFDYFMIFSIPGEEEALHSRIKECNEKGYSPLNKSMKYLSLIFEVTQDATVFKRANDKIESISSKEVISKEKKLYGESKRIALSDSQYSKLCKEYGEETVQAVIYYLDEYLEGNNNKNHYSNYYILIKRAIRDGWYTAQIEKDKYRAKVEAGEIQSQEVPDYVKDFLGKIK